MSNLVLPKIRWSVTGLTERQRGEGHEGQGAGQFLL